MDEWMNEKIMNEWMNEKIMNECSDSYVNKPDVRWACRVSVRRGWGWGRGLGSGRGLGWWEAGGMYMRPRTMVTCDGSPKGAPAATALYIWFVWYVWYMWYMWYMWFVHLGCDTDSLYQYGRTKMVPIINDWSSAARREFWLVESVLKKWFSRKTVMGTLLVTDYSWEKKKYIHIQAGKWPRWKNIIIHEKNKFPKCYRNSYSVSQGNLSLSPKPKP